ncbi:hypothetical protein LTR10_008155 [Elasticomyces elasticus]|nr:hypothetical protein LTR10_008155 [Elasticomyces elasticus]
MAPPTNRKEILASFRKQIDNGTAIVGAGAGIGLSAKFVEAGGGDLIIIYNSGRFRMAGRGSLAGLMPYGNANDVVVDMAKEVLPVVQHTPVIAGVCASDPFRDIPKFLKQLKELGFAGVSSLQDRDTNTWTSCTVLSSALPNARLQTQTKATSNDL